MFERIARLLRRSPVAAVEESPAPAAPTFAADCAAIGSTAKSWIERRRIRASLYSSVDPAQARSLAARDRARADATLAAAERLLRHEFDLLGSGPFVPADRSRPPRGRYTPIDWYWDPVRRLRFPSGIPHKQWNLLEMRPPNADVKYPWELGRCQHWIPLGQAFLIGGDRRYAVEVAQQLDDFVEANPTGIGVNWTCTMDVGLRAANWAIALEMIRGTDALDEAFWMRAYSALFDHGVFIRNNLENTYEVTSNHFLSNLLGLQFAGAIFDDLAQGREWTAFARRSIQQELAVQVLPDGADYESSIPYHRLVAELFLGAVRLADHQGEPFAPSMRARVRQMIEYLAAVVRPDGLMPQVGDADDGRLHIFEGYATTSPQDPRHIFGPAAMMFGEPCWLALGGDVAKWEAAWWGFAPADASSAAADLQHPNGLFANAGVAVARTSSGSYLLATNGIVGTNGFGNHKHNDQLSFEYHRDGVPLVVDPGSYVYTSDGEARNHFRSTRSHNTIAIDGVEQNDMRPEWLFRMFETSAAESVSFEERGDVVEYVGRHHGYERLPDPVTHERVFRLSRASGDLTIVDRLTGRGRHTIRWHFHCAPGVAAERTDDSRVMLCARGRCWTLAVPRELSIVVRPAAYSPSYGVKIPCIAVDGSLDVDLGGERVWEFAITS